MTVSRTRLVGMALVIFAATVWLYWPSVHGEFLGGDDNEYLRQSERWNGLTWNAVKWAFTSTDIVLSSRCLACRTFWTTRYGEGMWWATT